MAMRWGTFALRFAIVLVASLIAPAQTEDRLAEKSREANALMQQGRFAEAVTNYEELVRALPANPGLRLNLGMALQMAGRIPESVPHFEAVIKAQPASVPALLSLGMARVQMGQAAQAIAPLQKVVAAEPSNVNARGLLAQALLEAGRPAEAATQYRRLTALTPKDTRAWSGLGRAYEVLAAKAFSELKPESAEWAVLAADSRRARGQNKAAFFFYRKALELMPSFRGVHASLAEIYRAAGHAAWAVEEEAKEKSLKKPDCVAEKEACAFAAGRYLEAAAGTAYWRAKAYNELARRALAQLGTLPESVELIALRAEIAANRGQPLVAVEEWKKALKLAPGDERLERELMASLSEARDYDTLLPLLREHLKRSPADAELNYFMGDALLRQEKPEEAVPYLEAAVKASPDVLAGRALLGQALARAGRAAEAIPHLEAAVRLDEDGAIHYQMSRAYQAAGQAEKARAALERYQEIRQKSEAEKRDLEQQIEITAPSAKLPGQS
ncbi:MAG: tetratricopeptide repeat protein [Bryobacteraceae bacterium]|nr:tetratricopeptide repeat protein [Bryobacteraceae bacterium]